MVSQIHKEEIVPKTWKVVARFDSFDEADQKRNAISKSGKETRVRRCGLDGSQFAVKVRTDEKKPRVKEEQPPPEQEEISLGDKRKEKRVKKQMRRNLARGVS